MSLLTVEELTWLSRLNFGQIISERKFEQALTNEVFLLTDAQSRQAVFKRLNLNARNGQDRKRELAVQRLACERGLTPKVLADCGHCRLQEYIKGETLLNCAVETPLIELLARQLQLIHRLPAVHAQPQRLAFELQLLKEQLTKPVDEKEFNHFLQLAVQLDKNCPQDVLCHGDLSLNNLLRSDEGQIKILDWEYAVLASAPYDLAFCCCINGFNAEQQAQLIAHYYLLHHASLSLSLAQLEKLCALYLSVFTYLNQLWAFCFLEN